MSSGDPRQTRGFRLRVWAARAVVTLERWWPAVWPALAVIGAFAVLSLFGLWLVLPLPLHLLLLAAFAAVLGYALWQSRAAFALASRQAGLSRLEQDSGIPHQPLRALDDSLPGDFSDPATRRLWTLHRQRLIDSLDRLKLNPPRSDLPRRDPWAVRSALLLVLLVALVHARGDILPRLGSAFHFGARTAQATLPPSVDLWVTPPHYTRRAPLVSEQTRGVAGACGRDRQRGARPGAPPARGCDRRGASMARPGPRCSRWGRAAARSRCRSTATRSCPCAMPAARRSPAG